MTFDDFVSRDVEHDNKTYTVYRHGKGPGILLMPEVPGITPPTFALARRIAAEGFTVDIPDLFGTVNKPRSSLYVLKTIAKLCISREFRLFAKRSPSPITQWLRKLCRDLHQELGGPGVGAIGMCITGNFALSLMVDPWLMAPVLSQPSLPALPWGRSTTALHMTDSDLVKVKQRVDKEQLKVLAMRFTHDPLCPGERFNRLREEFGEALQSHEIDSSKNNEYGHPRIAHSVLTEHLIDEEGQPTRQALDDVLTLFKNTLKPKESL